MTLRVATGPYFWGRQNCNLLHYFREGNDCSLLLYYFGNDCNLLLYLTAKHVIENFEGVISRLPPRGCRVGDVSGLESAHVTAAKGYWFVWTIVRLSVLISNF